MADSFLITTLRGSPSSRKTLDGMPMRCKRLPESDHLLKRVIDRLEFLHPQVVPLDDQDPAKRKFVDVVVALLKLMKRPPLLSRLASNEATLQNIRGLQEKLDDVQIAVGLADAPQMTQWGDNWEQDKQEQARKLLERVPKVTDRMLVNEIRGDKVLQEVLMTLKSGANWKGQSQEIVALKQQTYDRVSTYSHNNGLEIFDWYIPSDNVDYEDTAMGEQGTFGDVSRGTWIHDGRRDDVVVKRLFSEGNDSELAFLKQLQLWTSIPKDRHILQLFGGSHVSSPQFYVCENAIHGNLVHFLEENSQYFWQMFLSVAEGLQVLHARDTVHGALKCNNILVGADYTAKLTDFGFSSVRTLSAGLSDGAGIAARKAIRWKPKEVLEETGNEEPLFESDLYSMGMCMIEALEQEAPFAMDADEDIMEKIVGGELPDRPAEATDEMWDLITRLCKSDPKERPPLKDVLKELSAHAAEEKKLNPLPYVAALDSAGARAAATTTA